MNTEKSACAKCGMPFDDTDSFCPQCGTARQVVFSTAMTSESRITTEPPSPLYLMEAATRRYIGRYAQFSGRAPANEFWYVSLAYLIVYIIMIVINGAIRNTALTAVVFLADLVYVFAGLALLIPSLALTVRRLHDTGRSGWWSLVALVPFLGTLVYLGFVAMPSVPQANKWGPPDPL